MLHRKKICYEKQCAAEKISLLNKCAAGKTHERKHGEGKIF